MFQMKLEIGMGLPKSSVRFDQKLEQASQRGAQRTSCCVLLFPRMQLWSSVYC